MIGVTADVRLFLSRIYTTHPYRKRNLVKLVATSAMLMFNEYDYGISSASIPTKHGTYLVESYNN